MIPTRIHGILDYVVGAALIAVGIYLDPATAAGLAPLVAGAAAVIYSIFTRYELGVYRVIPMGTHLVLDGISGVLLALSPWIFGFADRVWLPHLLAGILEFLVMMVSKRVPGPLPTSPVPAR